MKKILVCIFLFGMLVHATAQKSSKSKSENEMAIRHLLDRQVAAWNQGNLDEFMLGYWKSDSILFIGSKVTAGWDSTLLRYKKSYPNIGAMGKLRFDILRMDFVSHDSYLVTGKYFLTREKDNPSGIFTLLFKKKKGNWVIVYDHTS
jgi:hypothetical protein